MYELKKIGKVFTSKFVETGPSSYEKKKRIYRAAGSQRLRNTVLLYVTGTRRRPMAKKRKERTNDRT